jgi:hypothetical protein
VHIISVDAPMLMIGTGPLFKYIVHIWAGLVLDVMFRPSPGLVCFILLQSPLAYHLLLVMSLLLVSESVQERYRAGPDRFAKGTEILSILENTPGTKRAPIVFFIRFE